MTGPRAGFERRVQGALDAAPSRIPVVLGGCGTGRTWLLQRLRERAPRGTVQYVDVERCASTPERFLAALTSSSPFPWHGDHTPPTSARVAFDSTLQFLTTATAPGGEPATFLLDEALELRTFESFPGLRHVLRELLTALTASHNRFVLTTRYTARAHRLLRDATARYEVMHMPPLAAGDVDDLLAPAWAGFEQLPPADRDDLARSVQVLADGRSSYATGPRRDDGPDGPRGRPDQRPGGAAVARGRAEPHLPLLLRAAAAPRPRLRRTEGHPRDSGGRRAAEPDRDLDPAAAHAGIHEGLPVVARGRGPGDVAAEALQLRRPAAARLGAAALPARRRPAPRTWRARSSSTRSRDCRRRRLPRRPRP